MRSQVTAVRAGRRISCESIIMLLVVWFSPMVISPAVASAAEPMKQFCSGEAALSAKDFQSLLADFSIRDHKFREALVLQMSQKTNMCRAALERRLEEIQKKPADFVSNTGRNAALTLGLVLEIPLALKIIEAEMQLGESAEWLDMLRQWNQQAYRSALRRWLVNDAFKRRKELGLSNQDVQNYGLRQIEEFVFKDGASKSTSLILQLYLKDAVKLSSTVEEFTALNVHYASLRPGVRRIFKDSFARLVKKSPAAWVQAFRSERSWTQFQLLELMEAAGGAEIVRELLWLSEHHIDRRMKLRAQLALSTLTL